VSGDSAIQISKHLQGAAFWYAFCSIKNAGKSERDVNRARVIAVSQN
jgi:hypothetical protein